MIIKCLYKINKVEKHIFSYFISVILINFYLFMISKYHKIQIIRM